MSMNYDNQFDQPDYYEKDKKRPASGPTSLCYSYKEKIRKSIAFHEGRYIPNTDGDGNKERLISKEYLVFLRNLL